MRHLRVATYCRVSTELEEQTSSIELQKRLELRRIIAQYRKREYYNRSVAEVVKVVYFAEEDVLPPLKKSKHIIRKCTDDDFNLPEEVP